jgi:DNA-binding CsgD family transcriptional regulator
MARGNTLRSPIDFDSRCSECLLYGAIQGLADGLVLVDCEGRIFHLNRRAESILGVHLQRIIGTTLGSALSHTGLASLWATAATEDDPVTADIPWPSGQLMRATASVCRSAAGRPIGRSLLLRDVTKEKRIQVELSESVARRFVKVAGDPVSNAAVPPLTQRELQVLRLLAGGLSNGEIATRLSISVNTVASHIKHLYPKIKVNSRAAALAYAMTQGIQPPGH